jgi:hypothetical protein
LASVASYSVSKRPIWLLEAAERSRSSRPTMARIAGSRASRSASLELRDRDLGEPQDVIQLTVGEQAAVGGDPGTVEFELDPAVERWASEAAL